MSAASDEVMLAHGPAIRWMRLAALVVFAACGGDRKESPGAGTEGTAVADSAPTPPADTIDVATADSATPPSATSTPASSPDTAAKQPAKPAAKPAAPAPKPAKPSAPAAPAQDTAAATQGQGTGETQTADAPLRDQYHQAPKDTVNQATYDGWKQYNLNCARCHGEDVLGSTIAPHLVMSLKPDGPINTPELFTQVVCAGRPDKGMPSWCALGMDPAKIGQIYSYVKGRSEAKIGPGRPAVKPEG
jgi:type IV secretory pathway VirB10-like protein